MRVKKRTGSNKKKNKQQRKSKGIVYDKKDFKEEEWQAILKVRIDARLKKLVGDEEALKKKGVPKEAFVYVSRNYGETRGSFYFHDERNHLVESILDCDSVSSCHSSHTTLVEFAVDGRKIMNVIKQLKKTYKIGDLSVEDFASYGLRFIDEELWTLREFVEQMSQLPSTRVFSSEVIYKVISRNFANPKEEFLKLGLGGAAKRYALKHQAD